MSVLGKLFILFLAAFAVQGKNLRFRRLTPVSQIAGELDFPHQVSIQRDGNQHCGGSLISKRHVLTAAHCVHDSIISPETPYVKGTRLVVEVGSTRIGLGTKHSVKRISQIREYAGDFGEGSAYTPNDIAVLTLKTPVTESAKVKIINLPTASTVVPVGTQVTVSGFGSAVINGSTSKILKTSTMFISEPLQCNDFYVTKHNRYITTAHICAHYVPGAGTCTGDSGGPLILGNTLIGVVSGGSNECGLGNPDVYTKVSDFLSYIQYEMNYTSGTPEGPSSPSLAVNIDEVANPVQLIPMQNVQYMDPTTGVILPPESVILVDEAGRPIQPVTSQFPYLPLYPIIYIYQ